MFGLAVVTILLSRACGANDRREISADGSCYPQSIMRNHIIDVNASRLAGAVFIRNVHPTQSQTCADVCCGERGCNLAVYRQDASGVQIVKDSTCYLFDCQTPSVCKLTEHGLYSVAIVSWPAVRQPEVGSLTATAVLPKKGVAFLSACHQGDTCEGINTECSPAGMCACKENYRHKNGVCRQRCDPVMTYECVNGKADYSGPDCIAVYDVCNGIPDCSDGSDEIGCSEGAAWHEGAGVDGHADAEAATTPSSGLQANAQPSVPAPHLTPSGVAIASEQKLLEMAPSSLPPSTQPTSLAAAPVADAQLLAAVQHQQAVAMTTAAAQRTSAIAALTLSSLLALALAAYGVRRCLVGSSRAGLVHKVKAMGWGGKSDADYLVNGMYL